MKIRKIVVVLPFCVTRCFFSACDVDKKKHDLDYMMRFDVCV